MTTMLDDIIRALKNLGGQGTLSQIYAEVERIRTTPLPKSWHASIRGRIEDSSSDSQRFTGKDYFRKVGKGTWALRNQDDVKAPKPIRHIREPKRPEVFSQLESFETVSNYLKTIKEYRDYSDPDSPLWIDYIQEFFHIMGFRTEKKDARLMLLRDMSGDNAPKAIVVCIFPKENYDEIVPALPWETYLRFAANYHNLKWGVLTNGLQLRIINYQNLKAQPPMYWTDLDRIIQNQKSDSFFTIYKALSHLKNQEEEVEQLTVQRQKKTYRTSGKAWSKYVVTINGVPETITGKRNVIYHVVRNLCENGIKPERIAELIHWRPQRTFFSVDGVLSSPDFVSAAMALSKRQGKPFRVRRWFIEDDELIHINNKTYAFSKIWGKKWDLAMQLLIENSLDTNISLRLSDS